MRARELRFMNDEEKSADVDVCVIYEYSYDIEAER